MRKNKSTKPKKYTLKFVRELTSGHAVFKFKPDFEGEPDLEAFLDLVGIEEIAFNKANKSLLVVYNEKEIALEDLFESIGAMKDIHLLHSPPGKSSEFEGLPIMNQFLYESLGSLNSGLLASTKGNADITTIVPSALMLLGFTELAKKPHMPPWHALMWYGLNMHYWRYNMNRSSKMHKSMFGADEEMK